MTTELPKAAATPKRRLTVPMARRRNVWTRAQMIAAGVASFTFLSLASGAFFFALPSSRSESVALRDFVRTADAAKAKLAKCSDNASGCDVTPAISEIREARNTYYQATSAHWARVSALTSLFSTLIGGVGMALVLLTLRETRRATRAAIDGQRAWIRITACKLNSCQFRVEDGKVVAHAHCSIDLANVGQTPALNVRPRLVIWLVPHQDASDTNHQRRHAQILLDHYSEAFHGQTLFPGQMFADANHSHGAASKSFKHFPQSLTPEKDEYFHFLISAVVTYQISSGASCVTFETYSVYRGEIFTTSKVDGTTYRDQFKLNAMHNLTYAD